MSIFDPPADPFGDEKHCRICDGDFVQDDWTGEWYCPNDHEDNTVVSKDDDENQFIIKKT